MPGPWLTSDDLISGVKRKISFPVTQDTFQNSDILAFANEEMMISQVPSILQFHEEYFVTAERVPLKNNKSRYPIPQRSIGHKLRDVFYEDSSGNLTEMTRINPDDKAHFQSSSLTSNGVFRFYLEGNEIVLTPDVRTPPTGSKLVFFYYLRPNNLVENSRAAIITHFSKTITITNSSIIPGDTISVTDNSVTFTLTAVSSSPGANEFEIGPLSSDTASNLASTLHALGLTSNVIASGNVVTALYIDRNLAFSSDSAGIAVQETLGLKVNDVPDNITNDTVIDILQTRPGHKTHNLSVQLSSNAINDTTISINEADVSEDVVVGDYICSEFECIIPQIPTDLHTGLAERVCARVLAAIGDTEGYGVTDNKVKEIEQIQGTLIDQRVEGAPQKVLGRNGFLGWSKRRMRFF